MGSFLHFIETELRGKTWDHSLVISGKGEAAHMLCDFAVPHLSIYPGRGTHRK